MKNTVIVSLLAFTLALPTAHAAPSDAQLDAAASDPAAAIGAVLNACETDAEAVDALAAVIARIQAGSLSDAEKQRLIALVVGHAVVHLEDRAPAVIGPLAARVDSSLLQTVTAAAVYAGGVGSPAILEAIRESAGVSPELREMIEGAARNPVAVLGVGTVGQLPVAAPAAPPPPGPVSAHVGDVPLEIPVPVPLVPPAPPRPPAPLYVGQTTL